MEYLEHITIQGERWDQLAVRYYGDPLSYEPIIAANPHVAITPTLAAGVRLAIPIREAGETLVEEDLPPWKR